MVASVVIAFVVLVALSTPIVFALGLSGIIGLALGNFSLQKLPSALVAGSQSWVLLAVPTFVFAGALMERCGMSYALVNLARGLVGWVRGGLGMSVVLAEYFFSGISGSTIADVSAIGSMLTPPMLRAGYKPEHAASLVASATAMGILVPPAIFMIVLGQIMDTSVVAIFLGGFIPAAVTAACLMVVIFVQAHRLGWPKDELPSWASLGVALRASLVPLVVPVVIVLGFFFGVFTATEAGVAAVVYALLVGKFVYRDLKWPHIKEALVGTVMATGVVMFLVATSTLFAWLITVERVPQMIAQTMLSWSSDVVVQLLLINVFLIVLGTVLDVAPALILAVPILLPLVKTLGVDPIHFGVIIVLNVVIGLITPPVAPTLVITANIAKLSLDRVTNAIWKYLVTMIIVLGFVTYIPALSTWLPRLLRD